MGQVLGPGYFPRLELASEELGESLRKVPHITGTGDLRGSGGLALSLVVYDITEGPKNDCPCMFFAKNGFSRKF